MKYFVRLRLSENISETPEGFLVCLDVPIARTGEMIYGADETPLTPGPDGKVVIYRDEAEVFRPETIASFEGKPLTISHPEDFVTPENWKLLSEGTIQNVRRGSGELKDSLIADILVCGKDAINLVKSGLREVSCGYEADYEQEEDGKGTQKNIVGNHLALVDQGRAGSSYAINDHKGANKMSVKDKIKAIFAKAQDEAMKAADASLGGEQSQQDPQSGAPATADAMEMVTDLKKMMDAMMEKMSSMLPKDEAVKPPKEKMNAEGGEQANDDDEEGAGIEDRLKKLEAAVSKLLEREAKEDEVPVGDDDDDDDMSEEMGDDDDDDDDDKSKMKDEESEGGEMVGDTASRAEILAPGIEMTKNVKVKALKAAYATKEGKKVIDMVNGGKTPTFDSKEGIDRLFLAASEMLKLSREKQFAKTKQTRDVDGTPVNKNFKSAEDINEINAKFYGKQH